MGAGTSTGGMPQQLQSFGGQQNPYVQSSNKNFSQQPQQTNPSYSNPYQQMQPSQTANPFQQMQPSQTANPFTQTSGQNTPQPYPNPYAQQQSSQQQQNSYSQQYYNPYAQQQSSQQYPNPYAQQQSSQQYPQTYAQQPQASMPTKDFFDEQERNTQINPYAQLNEDLRRRANLLLPNPNDPNDPNDLLLPNPDAPNDRPFGDSLFRVNDQIDPVQYPKTYEQPFLLPPPPFKPKEPRPRNPMDMYDDNGNVIGVNDIGMTPDGRDPGYTHDEYGNRTGVKDTGMTPYAPDKDNPYYQTITEGPFVGGSDPITGRPYDNPYLPQATSPPQTQGGLRALQQYYGFAIDPYMPPPPPPPPVVAPPPPQVVAPPPQQQQRQEEYDPGPDRYQRYLQNNPDVAREYAGTTSAYGDYNHDGTMDVRDIVEGHYGQYGQEEGRASYRRGGLAALRYR